MQFLYTRVILVLAGIGLVGMGINSVMMLAEGQSALPAILTLLLAVALGYVWYMDWVKLGKCATALDNVKKRLQE
jgi:hypothetical protein